MRYEKIQGLKGIAAIAIAYFFHYAVLLAENPFSGGFLKNSFFVIQRVGGYAPDLFFLISGIDNIIYPCLLQDIKLRRFELGNRFKAPFYL